MALEPLDQRKLRILCGLTVACLTLPSCRKSDPQQDAAWWSLEADRVELAQHVELLKMREARFDTSREEMVQALDTLAEARQTRLELNEEASLLREDLLEREVYVTEWLEKRCQQIRLSHHGDKLDELTSRTGRTYRQVRISRVTEAGIEFKHESGIARLTADDLSRQQLVSFGINAERSQEIVSQEAEQALAYSEAVERTNRAIEKREREREQLARVIARQKAASRPTPIADTGEIASTNPLRQQPRSLGRTSRYYNVWNTSRSYYCPPRCGTTRYSYQSPYRTFAPTRPRTAAGGVWTFPDPNPTSIRR